MNGLAIIGVPSSAGGRRTGQEKAPAALRAAGLVEELRTIELNVVDFGDLPMVPYRPDKANPLLENVPLINHVAANVSFQVQRALQQGLKPIVLGGDCSLAFGVFRGLVPSFPNLGVIYFDGDAELETPGDVPVGIMDGMGVAHHIGIVDNDIARSGPRFPLMPEEQVCLFGYNEDAGFIQAKERDLINKSAMMKYPATSIRGQASAIAKKALAEVEAKSDQIFIHFDVDVMGCEEFPAADVDHKNGLTMQEASDVLQALIRSEKFLGLAVTEFNPDKDTSDGTFAKKLVSTITSAFQFRRRECA